MGESRFADGIGWTSLRIAEAFGRDPGRACERRGRRPATLGFAKLAAVSPCLTPSPSRSGSRVTYRVSRIRPEGGTADFRGTKIDGGELAELRQHRQHRSRAHECPNPGGCFPPRIEVSWQPVLTVLTALTIEARFSIPALILIVRVPAGPSRVKDISMPSVRRNVCARRSRPARAPGFFGQLEPLLPARALAARRRSEAVPAQLPRSAMSTRTQTATGSASMIPSTAALRFAS